MMVEAPAGVAAALPDDLVPRAAGRVPDDGIWGVDAVQSVRRDTVSPFRVAARFEPIVEGPATLEGRAARHHVARSRVLELGNVAMLPQTKDHVVQLDGRWPLLVAWEDLNPSADEATLWIRRQFLLPSREPVGIRDAIGVRKGQHVAPGDLKPAVASGIGPRLRFLDKAAEGKRFDQVTRRFGRAVVDDDYLEPVVRIRLLGQGGETQAQAVGVVEDGDDDGDKGKFVQND